MDKKIVIRKVRRLMKMRGIRLTKLGEVLGSRGCQQAKIDRANRFIRGSQKSVSLDEIKKLAKFFSQPESYFLQSSSGQLREEITPYGKMNFARIEKLSVEAVDDLLRGIQKQNPQIFRGVRLTSTEIKIKRLLLKIFYRKIE